ncbi:glycoside hydrolase family 3 protein [Sphingomonas oligoaromativorans]|uniref:glycoside hydrolase family 3 protein n=1 Tax=Sphingomonas oligoaromativorans TaxID=575322 RepID=UPI0014242302|nr:glycoside hydrolase family 3 protein [Sphingomonas oligoaromativorans]NIJ33971.1 beta-glucosidase [Sphingomonas oligoaromativorans]
MRALITASLIAIAAASSVPVLAAPAFVPLPANATAHPALWPAAHSVGLVDAKTEAFVTSLMKQMSLREKVGQMIQGDIASVKPKELREYPLGSVLGGGNSPPLSGNDRGPVGDWIKTAEAFRQVSIEKRPGHVPIPTIFGMDSVHGNSNVFGATIFPHNIGLGAMRDPALMEKIGAATAQESAASGFDWAFGPTVTVPQDDRWGRTYEGYSERPDITKLYSAAMVRGLQGAPGTGRIQNGKVAASIKHFLADGGTHNGIDQGDAQIDEKTLIETHAPGYISGIDAGAMTVMASFSSWNGVKNHGNKSLLTDVLKGRLGFEGFVVGDWNAHGQVPGCTTADCPQSFNAGLDMAMVPSDWKALFDNTLKEVQDGTIPMARVDDAVRRILRVKVKLGLFDPARPYEQKNILGSPEHRAIARQAVAESLVLLKNNNALLPIRPGQKVLVTGTHADDIGMQTGGWTLSWQGTGNTNADFPGATSIWGGLKSAIEAAGGTATLSRDGKVTGAKPDVAVVVFGETPYAEMVGDISTLEFQPGDKQALAELKALKAQGIPVVSVFISGRPLWVNPELNQSDAFVAAFLPGSEGEGVADVLVAKKDGTPNKDFRGKLSYSWPKTAGQFANNVGQPGYDPLFAYGYGLTYADHKTIPQLSEVAGVDASLANISVYYVPGKAVAPWKLGSDGAVTEKNVDGGGKQEGARQYAFTGAGHVRVSGPSIDLTRQTNAQLSLRIDYRVDTAPKGKVTLSVGDQATPVDATSLFAAATPGQWTSVKLPLACFKAAGADVGHVTQPFVLGGDAGFTVSIVGVKLDTDPAGAVCPGAPAAK